MLVVSCINAAMINPAIVWAASWERTCQEYPELAEKFELVLYVTDDVDQQRFIGLPVTLRSVESLSTTNCTEFGQECTEGMTLRLRVFDQLFANGEEKILYTDVDTLFNGDISDLLEAPVRHDLPIGACPDYLDMERNERYYKALDRRFTHKLNMNPNYFNSGVMVVHLPGLMSNLEIFGYDSLVEMFHAEQRRYVYPDQDLLNELVRHYAVMPTGFNARADVFGAPYMGPNGAVDQRRNILTSPIIHYFGRIKPWTPIKLPSLYTAQIPFEEYAAVAAEVQDRLDPDFVRDIETMIYVHLPIIDVYHRIITPIRTRD